MGSCHSRGTAVHGSTGEEHESVKSPPTAALSQCDMCSASTSHLWREESLELHISNRDQRSQSNKKACNKPAEGLKQNFENKETDPFQDVVT